MRPHVLAVSKLPDPLLLSLDQNFRLHRQTHEIEPTRFDAEAPHIRAAVVGGKFRLPRSLMERMPALEIAAVVGAGYDGVDLPAALERGILVTHTPAVHTGDVADFAMAMLLSLGRQLPQADRFVREGRWLTGLMPFGPSLSGRRVGLVGMGHVGRAVAARAGAFGMTVAYTARTHKPELSHRFVPSVVDLAAQVDFLVVVASGGDATRHLIGPAVLEALGPDGHLINVARGTLVDQRALLEALARGSIAGAALDVFDGEPEVPRELMSMDNVLLAPHIASATRETRQAMFDLTVDNLRAHFAGDRPPHLVPECVHAPRRSATRV